MLEHAVSDHVQVDVHETAQQMLARLYRCRVVPVPPERAFPVLAKIKFL
jgi:hypothetical protein